jgi:hypothetical protein
MRPKAQTTHVSGNADDSPRGVHGRHAQDMSLITSDNVHQRPQWRIIPLGRLIRPMRMRPARPLDPPLDTLRTKNVEKGSRTKKKRASSADAGPQADDRSAPLGQHASQRHISGRKRERTSTRAHRTRGRRKRERGVHGGR